MRESFALQEVHVQFSRTVQPKNYFILLCCEFGHRCDMRSENTRKRVEQISQGNNKHEQRKNITNELDVKKKIQRKGTRKELKEKKKGEEYNNLMGVSYGYFCEKAPPILKWDRNMFNSR